ncbi:NAD-dependent epimerase/dehydratase family protein [Candidatus Woesearchaeota archaeon]|nr:NAD-dependent epimerase/dehydratase family protein [Candidatus Woesearchaeota archaeon]
MGKVLLVGGAGFIGVYLAKELLNAGDEVVIYDAYLNYIDPAKSNYDTFLHLRLEDIRDKVKIIRGDIRNKARFFTVLKEEKPESVVLLAALPIASASNTYSEDAMDINLHGTVQILESLRQVDGIKRFLYTSSSMTYGNFEYAPADEKHPTNPMGVYGGTKLAGEILTRVYSKQFGIDYTIIRPSAVYGPTDANRRVSQIFVENAIKGKPLVLHDGGSSKLDFSYIEDVAKGFFLALKSPKAINQTFNITKGEGRSLKELAEIIKELVPNTQIISKPRTKAEKSPERGALDISKAKKLLGYAPKYSLEEGMKKYVEYVKSSGVLK